MRSLILMALLIGTMALVGCGEPKTTENPDTSDPNATSTP